MKAKLIMMVAMAMACAAVQLTAMPTEAETQRAEPVVKKLLAGERAALKSGRKTRSEVAVAAMKLADEADADAAKLLLMKGAFVLYVRDGKLEKAVETMKALEAAIADMPPQSVTNMIEMALLGVANKGEDARLYKLIDESKAVIASRGAPIVVEERNSIASILKGMIKVPGGDLWLSETELTQGQWEAVMENNPSLHKGVNLPVENISRDECDVFLEKLNQTKEVQASQFEFCIPGRVEWARAARAGNPHLIPWIKPGVAGELLDMAWLKENSDGETHAVATKVPNAFGFYDMVGNVHEWVIEAPETRGTKRGYSFANPLSYCRPGWFFHHERNKRFADTGLRLAAHVRILPTFALNTAPGCITEINLGNVPPLQFVYCPAGKFSMGYKEHPAISKVKDVEITSPFWVSKTVIRADQLESLGISFATNSITNGEKREAWINDASIVVQKLPLALKERFGKMLPPGYVFRLPTEAEFEYLQKAESENGDSQTNIWGVERLYSGDYIGLLDRAPAYGRGVDVVNRRSRGTVWTDLAKVNYENQPDKDPVGWSDDPNWSVFRRGLRKNCGGGKLLTGQSGKFLYGFYFVVAPDVDKLNKFYWK